MNDGSLCGSECRTDARVSCSDRIDRQPQQVCLRGLFFFSFICAIAQERIWKFCSHAARVPRGGREVKTVSCPIAGMREEYYSEKRTDF